MFECPQCFSTDLRQDGQTDVVCCRDCGSMFTNTYLATVSYALKPPRGLPEELPCA